MRGESRIARLRNWGGLPSLKGVLLRRARAVDLLAGDRRVEIALASLVQLLSGRPLHDGSGRCIEIALPQLIEFVAVACCTAVWVGA